MDKFEKSVIGLWLLGLLATVAFWVGVGYVVLHFVAKVW